MIPTEDTESKSHNTPHDKFVSKVSDIFSESNISNDHQKLLLESLGNRNYPQFLRRVATLSGENDGIGLKLAESFCSHWMQYDTEMVKNSLESTSSSGHYKNKSAVAIAKQCNEGTHTYLSKILSDMKAENSGKSKPACTNSYTFLGERGPDPSCDKTWDASLEIIRSLWPEYVLSSSNYMKPFKVDDINGGRYILELGAGYGRLTSIVKEAFSALKSNTLYRRIIMTDNNDDALIQLQRRFPDNRVTPCDPVNNNTIPLSGLSESLDPCPIIIGLNFFDLFVCNQFWTLMRNIYDYLPLLGIVLAVQEYFSSKSHIRAISDMRPGCVPIVTAKFKISFLNEEHGKNIGLLGKLCHRYKLTDKHCSSLTRYRQLFFDHILDIVAEVADISRVIPEGSIIPESSISLITYYTDFIDKHVTRADNSTQEFLVLPGPSQDRFEVLSKKDISASTAYPHHDYKTCFFSPTEGEKTEVVKGLLVLRKV